MRKALYFLGIIISMYSCDESSSIEQALPGANGDPSELVIVMDDDFYNTSIKDSVSLLFQDTLNAYLALETKYDLKVIPRSKFDNFYRVRHHILDLRLDHELEKALIEKNYNVFANRQLKINVKFTKFEELMRIMRNSAELFKTWFDENEIEARKFKLKRGANAQLAQKIKEKHPYTITVPKGTQLIKNEADFVWLALDQVDQYKVKSGSANFDKYTIDVIRGVVITERPYVSDSMLYPLELLKYRDEVMRKLPVLNDSAYMFTYYGARNEFGPAYEPLNKEVNFNGQFGVEMEGIFRTEGATFGGQWVSIATVDEKRGVLVNIDGYLHCPNSDKRIYQAELKAWLYSLVFDYQLKDVESQDSTALN